MTREVFIGKILHLLDIAIREDWNIDFLAENIERVIETYRLISK